jgi:hypothetical protein
VFDGKLIQIAPRLCRACEIGGRIMQNTPHPYPSPRRTGRGRISDCCVTQGCTPSSFTLGYNQVTPTGFQFVQRKLRGVVNSFDFGFLVLDLANEMKGVL